MRFTLLIILSALILFSCDKQESKDTVKSDKDTVKVPEITFSNEIMSAEMLMSMHRISSPQVSPDGKWILYSLSIPSIEGNSFTKDLYKITIDGQEKTQLTEKHEKNYNAIWSPDGKQIAFISTQQIDSTKPKSPQIWTMNPDGTNKKKITDIEEGVSNMAMSPDGKYFSFTSEVKIDKTPKDLYPQFPKANIRIYDKVPLRHWDHWIDDKYSHLFVIPAEGGEAKDLMPGEPYDCPLAPFGGGEQIAWSPDSKELAYTAKKYSGLDFVKNTNSEIYLVPVEGGEAKNITEGMPGYDTEPLYSPDGKWIAFNSMARGGFESDKHRLMLYNRENGEIKELSEKLDQWIEGPVWAPDSKSLFFTAGTKGSIPIYQMMVEDGSFKTIGAGWFNDGAVRITPDGKTLVFERQDMMHPVDFYTIPVDGGEAKQITNENADRLKDLKPATVKEKWVKATDGKDIHCWVLYPPDFDESKKYPMISYCQGGPQSMIGQRFHYRWNYYLMASHGYVVLLPNRRGVPGFGQDWNDAISHDWAGMPMTDILTATDEMLKEPYIDKEGVAAVGASAGGYAVFWLAGNHEGRFSAFISHCGVFNLESMYGSTEELWFPDWEYGGPYWEGNNKSFYDKHSPHRYIANWDTPLMISTGEYDFRVPYTQSLEAFQAAQVKGIDSKIVICPEETHFIAHPQEYIIWAKEFFGWLDKYCKK